MMTPNHSFSWCGVFLAPNKSREHTLDRTTRAYEQLREGLPSPSLVTLFPTLPNLYWMWIKCRLPLPYLSPMTKGRASSLKCPVWLRRRIPSTRVRGKGGLYPSQLLSRKPPPSLHAWMWDTRHTLILNYNNTMTLQLHYKSQDYYWKGTYWWVNPIRAIRVCTSGSETVEVNSMWDYWDNTSHSVPQLHELGYLVLVGNWKPKIKHFNWENRLKDRQKCSNLFLKEKNQMEDLTVAVKWLLDKFPDSPKWL